MTLPRPSAAAEGGRTGGRGPRLGSLTGLRFVTAVLIFWFHYCAFAKFLDMSPFVHMPEGAYMFGATGVTFFFLLSGFVLCWSHDPLDRPGAFYRRRFARIYPAYLCIFLATAMLLLLHGKPFPGPIPVVANLLLVQTWLPVAAIVPVGWSLSVEVFFYALFPALIGRLAALRASRRRRLMVMLLALTAFLGLVGPHLVWVVANTVSVWVFFPPARLAEFVIGILLALEVREGRFPRVSLNAGLVLVGLGLFVAGTRPAYSLCVMVVAYTFLIAAAAYRDVEGRPTVFSTRWFVTLGEWSYAFYLVHCLVLAEVWWFVARGGGLAGRSPLVGYATMAMAFAITLAASSLMFTWVERPMERRLRPARAGRPPHGSENGPVTVHPPAPALR